MCCSRKYPYFPPWKVFVLLSSLASYFVSKVLAFMTPPPTVGISDDLPFGLKVFEPFGVMYPKI